MEERLAIWRRAFPEGFTLANDINLADIAQRYELSGGEIMNVVQYVCLQTLAKESKVITLDLLLEGVRREFEKEGRIMR